MLTPGISTENLCWDHFEYLDFNTRHGMSLEKVGPEAGHKTTSALQYSSSSQSSTAALPGCVAGSFSANATALLLGTPSRLLDPAEVASGCSDDLDPNWSPRFPTPIYSICVLFLGGFFDQIKYISHKNEIQVKFWEQLTSKVALWKSQPKLQLL